MKLVAVKQGFFSLILGLTIALCTTDAFAKKATPSAYDLPEVKTFINEMVKKHQLSKKELVSWFKATKIQPEIIGIISKPYETQPWYRYNVLFSSQEHLENGLKYWDKNKEALARAEQMYGVPSEIIVAIIGVETRYGRLKGKYPVMNALTTLAFTYPPRSEFFRSELEELLLLVKEQGFDPIEIKGSYAGAMGVPQFMPSSYRHYAVDFSDRGQIDLINNDEDTIGSVANYFKMNGWQPNQPVAFPAKVTAKDISKIEQSTSSPKPKYTLSDLQKLGVKPVKKDRVLEDQKLALLSFEEQNGPVYWLGLNNFYVITRYNRSHHYAMAVYQLAEKLKQEHSAS